MSVAKTGETLKPDNIIAGKKENVRPEEKILSTDTVELLFLTFFDGVSLLCAYFFTAVLSGQGSFATAAGVILFWLISFNLFDLNEPKITLSILNRFSRFLAALTTAGIISITASALFAGAKSIFFNIIFWLVLIFIYPLTRSLANFVLVSLRSFGYLGRRTLVVGAGEVGALISEKIIRRPGLGLRLVGIVDKEPRLPFTGADEGIEIFTEETKLDELVRQNRIERVIITFSTNSTKRSLDVVRRCSILPVKLLVVPRMFEILAAGVDSDSVEGIPLMELSRNKLKGINLIIKRLIDFIISSLLITVLTLPGLLLALAIKIDSRGPVFFIQNRVGRNGKLFKFYKFRSMTDGAEAQQDYFETFNEHLGPMFIMKNDPRVTRVGRIMRRLSLDELPQLLNVLKGDMSLVGPRPQVQREVVGYKEWHKKRLSVTPGITGVWQVLGRNELPFEEMVKLDLNYIQNWSLLLDFKLLLQTIPAVLSRRGAY